MTDDAMALADELIEAAKHKSYWSLDDAILALKAATALRALPAANTAGGVREVIWAVEVDSGTDNACWVMANREDPGAVAFFMGLDFSRPDRGSHE